MEDCWRSASDRLARRAGAPVLNKYYNAGEVISAIGNFAVVYPGLASVIDLADSRGGKAIKALHLHANNGGDKDTIVFTGGVHGNEEGSSEILLEFAGLLLLAYQTGQGIQYGDRPGRSFQAAEIKSILDEHDIVLLPLVNPDGHELSQTVNPPTGVGRLNGRGVDINRNFGVMFDSDNFSPQAVLSVGTQPGQEMFRGAKAFSEPETRNVKDLLDQFPETAWFMDLHASGPNIQYVWGCDQVQHQNPAMSFVKPGYSRTGAWGLADDGIEEYMDLADLQCLQAMTQNFAADVKAAFGTVYVAKPSFTTTILPATSHDYAYGRHKMIPGSKKILAFMLEWGMTLRPPFNPFMRKTIEEISAGLTGFCLKCKASRLQYSTMSAQGISTPTAAPIN